jgi:sigma-B regulation protein RsbU (phosphoserine phosphatase)
MTAPNDPSQHSLNRLELLYRLSQTFNTSLDLDEVLNRVIDEAITILNAERGFIMLLETDGRQTFRVARGLDQTTIDQPQSQVSQSVVQRVAQEGQPVLTSDAQSDARFNMRQSVMLLGLRSVLCVPIKIKDKVLGVVYADNRFEVGIFTQADLNLLTAITAIAAIAIENARLYQMAVEKGRLQQELQMAREMQISFLPDEIPTVNGWDFAARWLPAREVAGDYYDFISFDNGQMGLVIADVTDKGAAAALFMVFTNSIVRASVLSNMPPVESLTNANRLISARSPNAMFVSLVYCLLDPHSGKVTYVNAGHNPPLYYNKSTRTLRKLMPTGMVLGIDPDAPLLQREIALKPGDFILFYTDGLPDAINAHEEAFGMQRLETILHANPSASAEELLDDISAALYAHTGGITPFDDISMLIAKCSMLAADE